MENQKLEQISALIDEQLEGKEQDIALGRLLDDADAQRVWQEYHLIRDCLQNNQTKLGFEIKRSLFERLKQEAILYVPKVPHKKGAWRGFAVAASVAAVTLAVWQVWPNMSSNEDSSLIATTAQTQNVAENKLQNQGSEISTLAVVGVPNEPVAVNSYLRAHQEAMGDGLMHASLQEGNQ